jgi:hypothetical protein
MHYIFWETKLSKITKVKNLENPPVKKLYLFINSATAISFITGTHLKTPTSVHEKWKSMDS